MGLSGKSHCKPPESYPWENVPASGDDINNLDDEDGVTFTTPLQAGTLACVDVVAGAGAGLLNAWIDFDFSGVWGDGPSESSHFPCSSCF